MKPKNNLVSLVLFLSLSPLPYRGTRPFSYRVKEYPGAAEGMEALNKILGPALISHILKQE